MRTSQLPRSFALRNELPRRANVQGKLRRLRGSYNARGKINFDSRTAFTRQTEPLNGMEHKAERRMKDPYFGKNTQSSPPCAQRGAPCLSRRMTSSLLFLFVIFSLSLYVLPLPTLCKGSENCRSIHFFHLHFLFCVLSSL